MKRVLNDCGISLSQPPIGQVRVNGYNLDLFLTRTMRYDKTRNAPKMREPLRAPRHGGLLNPLRQVLGLPWVEM
ncbi:hypothetical protein [Dyella nitratireducens]|uniref:Uncharacterized protein n=1 Tax=Dyella nitratireducens TaxID=1849580 RepID=A0ABQ1GAK7_9GAMM|nr:hypothetical protein [Dyella nitratireducens]GGA40005.1 hypothetical protein GCM10010981_31590 [Dyella nitratireducens]GLQ40517.1 hypothetical protein GCM10007902_03660 [Dyella nitratireducens]